MEKKCEECCNDMVLKCVDEGGYFIFWCPNCGCIYEGNVEDQDNTRRTPIGIFTSHKRNID